MKEVDYADFGRRVRKRRNELGWTQSDLAARLNITHQAVSKWENGVALPDITILFSLSQLFSTSMEELLTGDAPAAAGHKSSSACRITNSQAILFFIAGYSPLSVIP